MLGMWAYLRCCLGLLAIMRAGALVMSDAACCRAATVELLVHRQRLRAEGRIERTPARSLLHESLGEHVGDTCR